MSVAEIMSIGKTFLGRQQVLPGVEQMLDEVQVEGTFPDGSKLVTVHNPISNEHGDLVRALEGSFLPVPATSVFETTTIEHVSPGEIITKPDRPFITLNEGRETVTLKVTNNDDRPIQVGSHYHFIETNPHLVFDRALSYGKRLNIAAGTAVRFEPGETVTVHLVQIAGNQIVRGGNNLVDGKIQSTIPASVLAAIKERGFGNIDTSIEEPASKKLKTDSVECKVPADSYAAMFGPTTGDKVRLGDTNLILEVERDYTHYGDECKFGGGKVLRDGMGQASGADPEECLDLLITNALVVDATGIYKADIGVKKGRIVGIGKAGNPDVMAGVDPKMVFGVGTEVIAGEGKIVTAGAIDAHVHYICPQLADEAIASGITTLLGGGTGPATGTCATTCTPGQSAQMMLRATDDMPINFAFTGKGNSSKPEGLRGQIEAGCVGLKLHEDWGTTPACIDACLEIAEEMDVQVTIHTDTLNESCNVEGSVSSFKGRTIHTYHSEGAGGGHAPDIITVCGEPMVLPSSTNPTRPYTVNTIDEHVDMLMVCHHLDKNLPEDVAFAESRIRGETIAAEDILHDIGAISIMASDSQAMGRIGEVISRTWQTASKMKAQRGFLPGPGEEKVENDNFRIKRYVAKVTINPAIAHGMSHIIGSVETGKLADLCLWSPQFFGSKPEMVIKGGVVAWAQMGDANASIPTPEPVCMRPMFGALGQAVHDTSVAFVSQACIDKGVAAGYGLKKKVEVRAHAFAVEFQ